LGIHNGSTRRRPPCVAPIPVFTHHVLYYSGLKGEQRGRPSIAGPDGSAQLSPPFTDA
jgi:hypothetical protein